MPVVRYKLLLLYAHRTRSLLHSMILPKRHLRSCHRQVAEQFNEAENAEAVLLGAQDAQGQLEHLRTINKLLQVCKSRLELL